MFDYWCNEAEVRARIRRMHETGEVPCEDARAAVVWAGPGHGELCAACVQPIAPNETEFEVDLSSPSPLVSCAVASGVRPAYRELLRQVTRAVFRRHPTYFYLEVRGGPSSRRA